VSPRVAYSASRAGPNGVVQIDWERMIRPPRNPSRLRSKQYIDEGRGVPSSHDGLLRAATLVAFAGEAGREQGARPLRPEDQPKNAQQLSQSLHLDYNDGEAPPEGPPRRTDRARGGRTSTGASIRL